MFDQFTEVSGVIGIQRAADTGIDLYVLFIKAEGGGYGLQHFLGDARHVGGGADIFQHHREFIPAQPGNAVATAQLAGHAPAETANQQVAVEFTEVIVDAGELVDVDVQQGSLEVIALRALHGALKVRPKTHAVQGTGENVPIGQLADNGARLLQFYAVVQDTVDQGVLELAPDQMVLGPALAELCRCGAVRRIVQQQYDGQGGSVLLCQAQQVVSFRADGHDDGVDIRVQQRFQLLAADQPEARRYGAVETIRQDQMIGLVGGNHHHGTQIHKCPGQSLCRIHSIVSQLCGWTQRYSINNINLYVVFE